MADEGYQVAEYSSVIHQCQMSRQASSSVDTREAQETTKKSSPLTNLIKML